MFIPIKVPLREVASWFSNPRRANYSPVADCCYWIETQSDLRYHSHLWGNFVRNYESLQEARAFVSTLKNTYVGMSFKELEEFFFGVNPASFLPQSMFVDVILELDPTSASYSPENIVKLYISTTESTMYPFNFQKREQLFSG